MPVIVWGLIGVGGLVAGGWAVKQAGDASAEAAQLAKWAAIGGAVYVGYQVAKSGGYLK